MAGAGKLFVCATPIGNLGDVTLRVLDTLRSVDLVAAEDTRQTRKLLSRYEISVSLTSYHVRNEKGRLPELLSRLESGKKIALVSDAGMPGISDPGHRLISRCIESGIDVEVLPGPNAALTALVLSGLPTDVFTFAGFAPRKSGARKCFFSDLLGAGRTVVFYESPHRIASSTADLADVCPDCRVAVARELTKVFEEVLRGSAVEVASMVAAKEPRGEYVIVATPAEATARDSFVEDIADVTSRVASLQEKGIDRKEAMRQVAASLGVSRRQVYDAVVKGES